MDTSHMLARIFGIILIVLYSGVLLNQQLYKDIWEDVLKRPIILIFSGFINLLLGLLVVQSHSIWTFDWRGLVTLLGWLLIVSGVLRLLFPEHVLRFSRQLMERYPMFLRYSAIVFLLIGVYLTIMGFAKIA